MAIINASLGVGFQTHRTAALCITEAAVSLYVFLKDHLPSKSTKDFMTAVSL